MPEIFAQYLRNVFTNVEKNFGNFMHYFNDFKEIMLVIF